MLMARRLFEDTRSPAELASLREKNISGHRNSCRVNIILSGPRQEADAA